MIPVKNQPHLYRNSTGAIINTDVNDLLVYQKKKDHARRQQSDIENLKASINTLNADMNEIKSALKTIIEIIK
jgi:chaperonin cofactor prefoldin